MVKFIEIKSIETEEVNNINVYDIEVEDEHSYIANNYIVHNCTTSANLGIHYPIASLILECAKVKNELLKINNRKDNFINRLFNRKKYQGKGFMSVPKIIADGGMTNFDRIIKALACGADYVMLGQLLAQSWESAEPPIILKKDGLNEFGGQKWQHIDNNEQHLLPFQVKDMLKNSDYYIIKNYYGMSTKRAQKECGKKNLKTAEGIEKQIEVQYTLDTWVDNFNSYLKSAMSYTNCLNLKQFRRLGLKAFKKEGLIQQISPSAYMLYKK